MTVAKEILRTKLTEAGVPAAQQAAILALQDRPEVVPLAEVEAAWNATGLPIETRSAIVAYIQRTIMATLPIVGAPNSH